MFSRPSDHRSQISSNNHHAIPELIDEQPIERGYPPREYPHWFMLLECPATPPTPSKLTIGRYNPNSNVSPDVDINIDVASNLRAAFDEQIATKHIVLDLETHSLLSLVSNDTTLLNGETAILDKTYPVSSGDVLDIGMVKLLITFRATNQMHHKRFNLISLHYIPADQPVPNIHEMLDDIVIDELQTSCPKWVLQNARILENEFGITLEDALIAVLNVMELEMNISKTPREQLISKYIYQHGLSYS